MDYVTVAKPRTKLEGEANQPLVHQVKIRKHADSSGSGGSGAGFRALPSTLVDSGPISWLVVLVALAAIIAMVTYSQAVSRGVDGGSSGTEGGESSGVKSGSLSKTKPGDKNKDNQRIYFILALQWAMSFMVENRIDRYDPVANRFHLHGLWPQTKKKPAGPLTLNPSLFGEDIVTRAHRNWVNLFPLPFEKTREVHNIDFWSREWKKHGHESRLTQMKYFSAALELFDEVASTLDQALATKQEMYKEYEKKGRVYVRVSELEREIALFLPNPRIICQSLSTCQIIHHIYMNVSVHPLEVVHHLFPSSCDRSKPADVPYQPSHYIS